MAAPTRQQRLPPVRVPQRMEYLSAPERLVTAATGIAVCVSLAALEDVRYFILRRMNVNHFVLTRLKYLLFMKLPSQVSVALDLRGRKQNHAFRTFKSLHPSFYLNAPFDLGSKKMT